MRYFVVLITFCACMWACEGDCASCHTTLDYQNDKRHQPMLECKKCHTPEQMEQIDMGGCGKDCFACHNAQKLNDPKLAQSHKQILKCIECHTKLDKFNLKQFFDPQIKPVEKSFFQELPKIGS
ncbi:hypothetical protein BBW65_00160 [Helicobacter enhydrae]|uniref:Uncharacterized protein n=1 Tax=Helicobacter enhydrae TaxID=222136 RepID=A0A1B1U3K3_9HELI|nr:hypothetical protein [Helicobacter enhydrae]ANV97330.1 hypothetical protein BBW65_00160 [Helicobacter enhydrae]